MPHKGSKIPKIILFSFSIQRNFFTECLFCDFGDKRIEKIEKLCFCAIEEFETLIQLKGELFINVNILYEESFGNHKGCIQMLLMLLKDISIVSKTFYKMLPQIAIIKDQQGNHHLLDVRQAIILSNVLDSPTSLLKTASPIQVPERTMSEIVNEFWSNVFIWEKSKKERDLGKLFQASTKIKCHPGSLVALYLMVSMNRAKPKPNKEILCPTPSQVVKEGTPHAVALHDATSESFLGAKYDVLSSSGSSQGLPQAAIVEKDEFVEHLRTGSLDEPPLISNISDENARSSIVDGVLEERRSSVQSNDGKMNGEREPAKINSESDTKKTSNPDVNGSLNVQQPKKKVPENIVRFNETPYELRPGRSTHFYGISSGAKAGMSSERNTVIGRGLKKAIVPSHFSGISSSTRTGLSSERNTFVGCGLKPPMIPPHFTGISSATTTGMSSDGRKLFGRGLKKPKVTTHLSGVSSGSKIGMSSDRKRYFVRGLPKPKIAPSKYLSPHIFPSRNEPFRQFPITSSELKRARRVSQECVTHFVTK